MTSLVVIVGGAVAVAALAAMFRRRQGRGAMGGAMSSPKAYWLGFAVWFWFLVCPALALDDVVAPCFRTALGAFAAFMWLRGAVEMFMLYVTRSWRPPYGIAHCALSIALVGGALLWRADDVAEAVASPGIDRWALGLCAAVVGSLAVEIHHAWRFFGAVGGRTTGAHGVWFAPEGDPRFAAINRATALCNAAVTGAVGAFVARYAAEVLT